MGNSFFRAKDIIVIGALLILALILYIGIKYTSREGSAAEILLNNSVIKTLDLSEDTVYSPEAFPHVVFEVKEGAVRFRKSDCPDKICVNTGFISKEGQTAVCLPNRLVLRITGNDVDTVL